MKALPYQWKHRFSVFPFRGRLLSKHDSDFELGIVRVKHQFFANELLNVGVQIMVIFIQAVAFEVLGEKASIHVHKSLGSVVSIPPVNQSECRFVYRYSSWMVHMLWEGVRRAPSDISDSHVSASPCAVRVGAEVKVNWFFLSRERLVTWDVDFDWGGFVLIEGSMAASVGFQSLKPFFEKPHWTARH